MVRRCYQRGKGGGGGGIKSQWIGKDSIDKEKHLLYRRRGGDEKVLSEGTLENLSLKNGIF